MKKRLYISLLCALATVGGYAQDFQPRGEAQNLTERKNVTVDYSTGIFHYSVPLYTLRSGAYELPLSMDYIGKGVRSGEPQGIIDYNWSLNMGGVVTRTMRGGFPDEGTDGYLNPSRDAPPLYQDAKNVALRRRDGECDLFTAVFGGQKVDFILKKDADGTIRAEPLEKTHARIACIVSQGYISGWEITDDNGDKYVYRQMELHKDVRHVDVSTSNAVDEKSYVSAWHLSSIVPYNGKPIEFCYLGGVHSPTEEITTDRAVNQCDVSESFSMTYHYGRPVLEQSFDFERYNADFVYDMEEARYHLQRASREEIQREVDAELEQFKKSRYVVTNLLQSDYVRTNNCILGTLSNISLMENASYGLERGLNALASTLRRPPYGNSEESLAASHLENAARIVRRCLTELKSVTDKEIEGGSAYTVVSPLPYLIITPDRIVKFGYEGGDNDYNLSKVSLCDGYLNVISSVAVTHSVFSFLDKKGKETSRLKFEYYDSSDFPPLPDRLVPDIWGYPSARNASGKEYDIVASYRSLKKVSFADGGEMEITYEKNKVGNGGDSGGIRLKSLRFHDGEGRKDTVSYDYMNSGTSIYPRWLTNVQVRYSGFSDYVDLGRARPDGHPIMNTGNNGLCYTDVAETVNGRGKTVYTYQASSAEEFWKNGLFLGKRIYDDKGKLLRKVTYRYEELSPYSLQLQQQEPSPFYIDGESLEGYYESQTNQYIDGMELYRTNVEPRLSPTGVDRFYTLRYGGKMALSEVVEYRSDGDTPYLRTVYHYDNPESMYPTRVVRTGSDGVSRTEVRKRVIDMEEGADAAADRMRQRHLLAAAVKTATLIDGKLVKEEVRVYKDDGSSDVGSILPSEEWAYIPETAESYAPSAKEAALFAYGKENYERMVTYRQSRLPSANMITGKNGCVERGSVAYDYYGRPILTCEAYGAVADDPYKGDSKPAVIFPEVRSALKEVNDRYKYEYSVAFKGMQQQVTDGRFLSYCESTEQRYMMLFLDELQKKDMDLLSLRAYYDYLSRDEYAPVNRFKQEHLRLFTLYPQYEPLTPFITKAVELITYGDRFFDYLYQSTYDLPYPAKPNGWTITCVPEANVGALRLYEVDNPGESPSVIITHAGGETTLKLQPLSKSRVKVYEIDLSAYEDVTSVTAGTFEFYEAIVPSGASFQATSYNTDGTVRCRFDESGNAEFYTYDDAGRVIRVEDQYGSVLKEYEYNRVINN